MNINELDIKIFETPTWYLQISEYLKYFFNDITKEDYANEIWVEEKRKFTNIIADLLNEDKISLGETGPNHDLDRTDIDTVVIHHTLGEENATYEYLNALSLLRLYVPEFSRPSKDYFGTPICSNHIYKGRQTFLGYHYLIWNDGSFEQILEDSYVGWHAGDWNMNCRSIAIALVGDYTCKYPTNESINTLDKILYKLKKKYNILEVLGHCDVLVGANGPGETFHGPNGWRNELTNL
ncbi:N-acetylmuramoyl-L-alanine amidase [bacterium]|nr:MAG: N-acetylmuramoyl-L-alanine amidase [bacterium]